MADQNPMTSDSTDTTDNAKHQNTTSTEAESSQPAADAGAASDTETVEVELDPARSVMYRQAMEAGGPVAEMFLQDMVQDAVERAYDNRADLARALAEQSQGGPQGTARDAQAAGRTRTGAPTESGPNPNQDLRGANFDA